MLTARVACVVEGDARVSRGTTVLIASSSLSAGTFPAATVAATSAAARPSGITDLARWWHRRAMGECNLCGWSEVCGEAPPEEARESSRESPPRR